MVYLTALKLQAPAYYLKRRRAIIGNLNRLFKQKEKNFYIQKYNVILFVGGDFYWPCKKAAVDGSQTFYVVHLAIILLKVSSELQQNVAQISLS